MKLARVVGTVVSTINVPIFEDRTLLLCDLIDPRGKVAGGYMIAVDTVGAGPGETVLLMDEGTSARQILGVKKGPVRTLVVGIVDDVALVPSEEAAAPERPATAAETAAAKAPTAPKAARRPRKAHPAA
jgi:ethanolamine utilization protein EutN